MRKSVRFALVLFLGAISVQAQKKISVQDVYQAFRSQGMAELKVLQKSNQYTTLSAVPEKRTSAIELFDFATRKKVGTVISGADFPEIGNMSSYEYDASETKLLIAVNAEAIYRHSYNADYFLYDIPSKKLTKVLTGVQEPTFSPDGTKIAYSKENNLYVLDVASNQSHQITKDGKKNSIINGITDWVYEEEFAFVRAFDWSADSKKLAFIRFDESEVPEFTMDVYGKDLYPTQTTFKYPKAGEKNAVVSLHLYDLSSNQQKNVNLGNYQDFYIPRIKWTNDANLLSVQVLNRHQNNLDLIYVDATQNSAKIVLNEKDKAYVDITDNLTFLADHSFIWTSEKDGFNHIYHYDKNGKLKNQLTKGNWEVTAYYGYDAKSKSIFYQSTENGSVNRDVYSIGLSGKSKKRLTPETGTSSARFSSDYKYFIHNFSNLTSPPVYKLREVSSGKELQVIVENTAVVGKLNSFDAPQKEIFVLKTEKGHELNAWIMKPKNFDASEKYPVFMHQYSGPGSQQVANSWYNTNDYWFMSLTQEGYIVVCVDGRGTGYKGAEFKKCTQNQLGKYEVEDQIDAAKVIGKYAYVDASRIGIFGWSYGGFMSSNCLLKAPDVFKMAIAVAPVTNWRFYDTVYTERYLSTPQENPSGYDDNSPINFASNLKGNYLLIHGTADDNVHVQNAMRMIEALVQANKQFDWAIYPDKNHGIYGGKTRYQLYQKMSNYIINNL